MKHWIEFLKNRTHATKQMSKLANGLTIEVIDKQLQLDNAKANLERFELQVCNKIAVNYSSEHEYENAISSAKHQADKWNSEPIENHKPSNKNKQ